MKSILFLLFCLISWVLGQQKCRTKTVLKSINTQSTKIPLVETGSYLIISTLPRTRYNWFTLTFKQIHDLKKINFALNPIFIKDYKNPYNVDFSVRPVLKDNSIRALFTISVETVWTSTHVHYIITSRQQLLAGSFIANLNQLLQSYDRKRLRISQIIPNTSPKRAVDMRVYISGIKAEQTGFMLKVIQASYISNQSRIIVNLQLSNNKKPIQMLYFSYFGYSRNSRLGVNSFVGKTYWNSIIYKNDQDLSGILGIISFNGSAFLQQIHPNNSKRLLQTIKTPILDLYRQIPEEQLSIYKKVFEIQQLDVVSKEYLSPILAESNKIRFINGTCINTESCLQNDGVLFEGKGQEICYICVQNKTFNVQLMKCECKQQFIAVGDACVTVEQYCGANNKYQEGKCYTSIKALLNPCQEQNNEVYNAMNRSCVCQEGYMQQQNNGKKICRPKCPPNSYFNLQKRICSCLKDFYLDQISRMCVQCSRFQEWSQIQKKCVCIEKAVRNQTGSCVPCSNRAIFNKYNSTCQCWPGFEGNGLTCKQVIGIRTRQRKSDLAEDKPKK